MLRRAVTHTHTTRLPYAARHYIATDATAFFPFFRSYPIKPPAYLQPLRKRTTAPRETQKKSIHVAKCGICGWTHGKTGNPAECPPECDTCGCRHGAEPAFREQAKISSACREKVRHLDASRHDAYYTPVDAELRSPPPGSEKGNASAKRNEPFTLPGDEKRAVARRRGCRAGGRFIFLLSDPHVKPNPQSKPLIPKKNPFVRF